MPGVIHLLVASTISKSIDRGKSFPIATIFPSCKTISVFRNLLPSPSKIFPFLRSTLEYGIGV